MFKLRCARARKIRRQGGEIRLVCPPTSVFPREKKDWATNHVLYVFFFSLAFLSEFLCLIYLFILFIYAYLCFSPRAFPLLIFFTLFYRNSSFDKFRPLRGATASYSMTLALMDALGWRRNISVCVSCVRWPQREVDH